MSAADTVLRTAGDALLALGAERPWAEISLREIAEKAGVPLADLYALANGKDALLAWLSRRFDDGALATAAAASDDPHDRLFDAVMGRLDAMAPHRAALIAISRSASARTLALHLPRTARAILEAAGIEASFPRLAAMTAVWTRVVQVWRDDDGALNRTMAEIDKRLKQMRRQLGRVGAGF
ncbi:MAG: TetR family transcriptional regulator [Caulobacteraceae bacterium]